METNQTRFTMRIDSHLHSRLLRIAGVLQARGRGRVTASDVYRRVIESGIAALERAEGVAVKRARGGK